MTCVTYCASTGTQGEQGKQGNMRSLRQILLDGQPPSPVEEIEITAWMRAFPATELAAHLEEKFPHLVEPEPKAAGQR